MAKRNRKVENDYSAFLHFLDLFKHISDFSGCRRSVLISETVIRFFFPLAFQRCIRNCSTAKTCKDIAKRKRKVENNGKGGGYSLMLCVPNGTIHS